MKSIRELVLMIRNDCEQDAQSLDGQTLSGRTVGENFGKVYAGIDAIASICGRLLDRINILEQDVGRADSTTTTDS